MNAMYVQFLVELQILFLYIIRRPFVRYILISICIFFLTFVLIICLRIKYEEENDHHMGNQFHSKNYDEAYKDDEELSSGKTRGKYMKVDGNPEADEQKPLHKLSFHPRNVHDMRRGKIKFDDIDTNEDTPVFLKITRSPKGMRAPIPGDGPSWQYISRGFHAYSAFYDRRIPSNPFIRIIAAANESTSPTWCRLWYNMSDLDEWHFKYVKAKLVEGDAVKRDYFRSILVTCPVAQLPVPDFVSLMTYNSVWPHNIMAIRNSAVSQEPRKIPYKDPNDPYAPDAYEVTIRSTTLSMDDAKRPRRFSTPMVLCLKLPYIAGKKAMNLLGFLEIYMVLGVQHFFIYTSPNLEVETMCLFSNHTRDGTITLLPWVASYMDADDFVFEAKDSADNDCVYRAMYTYTYAVLVDMNEFIFPLVHDTLLDLLANQVSTETSALVSGFLFPRATFCLHWEKDKNFHNLHSDILQDALLTFLKTRRNKYLKGNKEYIIVPDKISSVASGLFSPVSSLNEKVIVSSKLALLREYTSDEDSCQEKAIVVDYSPYRFTSQMLKMVWERFSAITCPKVFDFPQYNHEVKNAQVVYDDFQ